MDSPSKIASVCSYSEISNVNPSLGSVLLVKANRFNSQILVALNPLTMFLLVKGFLKANNVH